MAEYMTPALNERISSSGLLRNLAIFVPEAYHRMDAKRLRKYGNEMLKMLLKHFCSKDNAAKRLFVVTGSEITPSNHIWCYGSS